MKFVGIKAQDALKVIPEAISKDDKGYYHVTNDAIIWTMFNAVKELYHKLLNMEDHQAVQDCNIASVSSEMAAKNQEITDLKNKVLKAEQENAEIKAYLCNKDKSASICH